MEGSRDLGSIGFVAGEAGHPGRRGRGSGGRGDGDQGFRGSGFMWGFLQVKLGIPGGEAVAAAAAEMMIPLKRIGTPDEAAGAMLMLASPYATFITGQARALPFQWPACLPTKVLCLGGPTTCCITCET